MIRVARAALYAAVGGWLGEATVPAWPWTHGHPDVVQDAAGALIGAVAGVLLWLILSALGGHLVRANRRLDMVVVTPRHRHPEFLDLDGVLRFARNDVMAIAEDAGVSRDGAS